MAVAVEIRMFPEQRAFIEAPERYVAAVSGIRGGKTEGGAIKAFALSAKHAGIVGMVTAPIYKTLLQATLPSILKVFPSQFASAASFNRGDMTLRCANGSMLYLRSTEDPDSLRGPEAGFVWMDEAALSPLLAWQILIGRLSQPGMPNCAYLTTTPKGYNWVWQEFAARERPGYRLLAWSARKNCFLPSEFIASLVASYTDPEFALQEIEGQFVLVGGACYFDAGALQDYLQMVQPPVADGVVKRWQKPIVGRRYCIGVDPAAGIARDRSAIEVVDWQSGQLVAEVADSRIAPDELAALVRDLHTEYNRALVGVEGNQSLAVVSKLKELGVRQYEQREGVAGWATNSRTRPVMLAELAGAVRQRAIGISSRGLVDEMFSFIRDDKGRVQAAEGAHDDRVMAAAIAWQMRHQHGSGIGFRPFVVRDGKRIGG